MSGSDTHGFSWPGGPDYVPPPVPRCTSCGGFLPGTPERREPWEEVIDCDGSATEHQVERGPGIAAILGEGTDTEHYSVCGSYGGQHTAHTEVMAAGERHYYACTRCGVVNVDEG